MIQPPRWFVIAAGGVGTLSTKHICCAVYVESGGRLALAAVRRGEFCNGGPSRSGRACLAGGQLPASDTQSDSTRLQGRLPVKTSQDGCNMLQSYGGEGRGDVGCLPAGPIHNRSYNTRGHVLLRSSSSVYPQLAQYAPGTRRAHMAMASQNRGPQGSQQLPRTVLPALPPPTSTFSQFSHGLSQAWLEPLRKSGQHSAAGICV